MEHKELLEKVANQRLEQSLNEGSSEEGKTCFKEAMEATDRIIELEKIDTAKTERKTSQVLRIIEVAAVPIALAGLNYAFKTDFLKKVMLFEKDDAFTGSAGRSVSSWFRFKD